MRIGFPSPTLTNYDAHHPLADVSTGQENSDYQEDVLGPREHHHVQRRRGRGWRRLPDDHGTHRRARAALPAAQSDRRAMSILWPDHRDRGADARRVGNSGEDQSARLSRRDPGRCDGTGFGCSAVRAGSATTASFGSYPSTHFQGHDRHRRAKLAVSATSVRIRIGKPEISVIFEYSTACRFRSAGASRKVPPWHTRALRLTQASLPRSTQTGSTGSVRI